MPMKRGSSRSTIAGNIREFHGGATYKRTAAKHGKATADRQAVAASMRAAGKSKKRKRTIAEGY